ncbi:hypothetical protein GCM10012284_38900 [Mangrovihabitans endophyticus]|uniref:HTH luxR-type domain-containing protein n=1 Tax=Mangrovihabitans endophyticus TaxID=1751298 RepID=A0A8J3FQ48_9ACTN|nr:hypothetical protein GCM10012284_38900 [Mangrovihabitans endophyticus]
MQFVSGVLVLAGGPGSGKSTLLRAAGDAAAGDRIVLTVPGHRDEAGYACAALHRLRAALAGVLATGGDAAEDRHDGAEEAGMALLSLLRSAARHRPVLVLLDDAHLLDRPSWAAVAVAAHRIGREPVAVVASVPDGYPPTGLPTRRLAPWDDDECRDLVLARAPDVHPDVVAALLESAGGNPGALCELAGALTPEQRRGDAPPPCVVPASGAVHQAYRDMLAAVGDPARRLLVIAAAARTLSVDEWDAACTAAGVGLSVPAPAEAAGLIDTAGPVVRFREPVLRAIVYHGAPLADRRWAHAVLARVMRRRGRRLPALLHRAWSVPGPDERLAAELVEAAACAGDHGDAADACARAAELTVRAPVAVSALVAGADHAWLAGFAHRAGLMTRRAERARRAARQGSGAGRQAGAVDAVARYAGGSVPPGDLLRMARHLAGYDRAAALDALLRAGDGYALAGCHDRYGEVADAVRALRRGAEPDGAAVAFAYVDGLDAMFRGDHPRAFAELRRVVDLGGRVDDPVAVNRAATAGLFTGDDAAARDLAVRAAGLAAARGEPALVPRSRETAAFAALALGDHGSAAASAAEGARLARATGQPALASTHLSILAVLAALAGDEPGCAQRVREAGARDDAGGPGQARALCEWALALLDLVAGRPRATVRRLLGIVAAPAGRGNVVMQVAATPHLVEAAALAGWAAPAGPPPQTGSSGGGGGEPDGGPPPGREAAWEAQVMPPFDAWTGYTGRPAWLALRERCRALRAADAADADDHFAEALRQHRADGADFPRAHTQLLYGRRLRRRRPVAAREHLRDAAGTFHLLGLVPWAEAADRELRAAGDHVAQPPPGGRALTAQQERIAALVARGATNREIAEQMLLSPRTVDHHLRNVFARLGVRSRTELAHLMTS